MLKAHVDKEILVNAITEFLVDPIKISKDFIDFLSEGSDLVIYGNLNDDQLNLVSKLLEGRQDSDIRYVAREYSARKSIIDLNNPYQVLFININDIDKQKIERNRNQFLCGFIDDYQVVYKRLSSDPYKRVKDPRSKHNFSGWSDILPNHPVTDVIISDPYLFKDETDQRPIEENYYRLLREFASKYVLDSLLVFAPDVDDYNKRKEIIDKSRMILGDKVIFGLMGLSQVVEHDRYIFMNYCYISTGSSINYFNHEGAVSVKSSSKIELFPLIKPKNFEILEDILRKLFAEFEVLKSEKPIPAFINSRLFYCIKGGC
ncbi:MAG: hypothetical protein NTW16_01720 [Bacteroidetes bacterium]|nr:hypothetical protein [Bacteroidota bacterium]